MVSPEAHLASVLIVLAVLLLVAKIGGDLAIRIGQPPVVGELAMGILLGLLPLVGVTWLERGAADPSVALLAELGVVLLLFEVGLESTVRDLLRVGLSSLLVACAGVAAPLALGWLVAVVMLRGASTYTHLWIGATLAATSVGITARVLKDLQASTAPEARIILGAAVIDDVLGLVILAALTGAVAGAGEGSSLSIGGVALVLGKAIGFLAGAFAIGSVLVKPLFQAASFLRSRDVLLASGLTLCFVLSWLAHVVGLAPIVGAFAAGVLLEEAHFRRFAQRGEPSLEHHIQPIASFLVPLFFVVTGLHVQLGALGQPGALSLAAALTAVAIVGKQVCGLAVVTPGANRLLVGIGMVPRGEVGLIFAAVGSETLYNGRPLLGPAVFAGVVAMVLVTTMATPPALKAVLARRARA
jgi:Kef-type K+ transport system membrane component KefB